MNEDKDFEILCNKTYKKSEYENFKWFIERHYTYSFFVDDLPSAYVVRHENTATIKYQNGIPVGYIDNTTSQIYLYNHLDINI